MSKSLPKDFRDPEVAATADLVNNEEGAAENHQQPQEQQPQPQQQQKGEGEEHDKAGGIKRYVEYCKKAATMCVSKLGAGEIIETFNAKVEGGSSSKIIYYIVFVVSVAWLVYSAGNILRNQAGVVYTDVQTLTLNEFVFPAAFMCIPKDIDERKFINNNTAEILLPGLCQTSQYLELEEELLSLNDLQPGSGELKCQNATFYHEFNYQLMGYFRSQACVLFNVDQNFKAEQNQRREMMFAIHTHKEIEGTPSYMNVGFFNMEDFTESGRDLVSNGTLRVASFRVGFQNSMATFGLAKDKTVVEVNSLLPSWMGGGTTHEELTTYRASVDSFSIRHSGWGDNDEENFVWMSYFTFYVSDFTTRIATEKTKTAAEISAALGGAVTAAMLLVSLAFKPKMVVEDQTNTVKTIFIFRYEFLNSMIFKIQSMCKKSVTKCANREAKVNVYKNDDDIAGGLPVPG